ncbi:hypothetical protein [Nonomuraea rubra]|uniref:hypothetical protein n=1 Tax=Nonomuraea rubra TaxID=46180 RepID=UPI0033D399AD
MTTIPRPSFICLLSALAVGAVFGAATSLANAAATLTVDLESTEATIGGWSIMEIVSILLDAGWAWAGLGVLAGWWATRGQGGVLTGRRLARGAVVGMVALLAATAAYYIADTVVHDVPSGSYVHDTVYWWVASALFGPVLGAIGACAGHPGAIGVLARLIVPVGAAVQMAVLPPGRNDVLRNIGQWVVWTAAAVAVGLLIARFLRVRRRASRAETAGNDLR